jgi:hypothetical protein
LDTQSIITLVTGLAIGLGQWALRRAVTEFDRRLERVEARVELVIRVEERTMHLSKADGVLEGRMEKVVERMDALAKHWRETAEGKSES